MSASALETLTQEELAHVLGPIWIAFAVSAVRLRELAEQEHGHKPLYCRRCDALRQAKDYLQQKAYGFDGLGLMVALDKGERLPLMWPNAYPLDSTMEAELGKWLRSNQKIRARLEAWAESDADFLGSMLRRLKTKRDAQKAEGAA